MSRNRPVIGVTSYDATASWGVWHAPALLLPGDYLDALFDSGAAPVALPARSDATDVADRLDGLVLIGGPDVSAARYGAARHPEAQAPDLARDELEFELVAVATERRLPLLAICRGLQVLNVARGGTLRQHVPDAVGHEGHSPGPGTYGRTSVEVVPTSRLAATLGRDRLEVDCYHHQAVDAIGTGLVVTARSSDGVIEAVEDPSAPFLVGVQWHPEVGEDRSLFVGLVGAASAR